jgi:murein DD-endopeptidase MepM/ murein hydrolase activator NlpD
MIRDGALLFWATVVCAAVCTACATTSATAPEPPMPPGELVEVQPGQTVWELSQRYGISVEEIVEVNGLENANELAAGQIIFIPAGGPRVADPPPPQKTTPAPPTTTTSGRLSWPVDGVVLRDFVAAGGRKGAYDGVLIAAAAGTAVVAANDGVVVFAGSQDTALGTLVIIDHGQGLVTVYGHLSAIAVKDGDLITRHQRVGVVGTSGLIGSSPRVHFQVRKDRVPVDPLPLLEP